MSQAATTNDPKAATYAKPLPAMIRSPGKLLPIIAGTCLAPTTALPVLGPASGCRGRA